MTWSTLIGHVSFHVAENMACKKDVPVEVPKLGVPFVLPKLDKLRLVKYIT